MKKFIIEVPDAVADIMKDARLVLEVYPQEPRGGVVGYPITAKDTEAFNQGLYDQGWKNGWDARDGGDSHGYYMCQYREPDDNTRGGYFPVSGEYGRFDDVLIPDPIRKPHPKIRDAVRPLRVGSERRSPVLPGTVCSVCHHASDLHMDMGCTAHTPHVCSCVRPGGL